MILTALILIPSAIFTGILSFKCSYDEGYSPIKAYTLPNSRSNISSDICMDNKNKVCWDLSIGFFYIVNDKNYTGTLGKEAVSEEDAENLYSYYNRSRTIDVYYNNKDNSKWSFNKYASNGSDECLKYMIPSTILSILAILCVLFIIVLIKRKITECCNNDQEEYKKGNIFMNYHPPRSHRNKRHRQRRNTTEIIIN